MRTQDMKLVPDDPHKPGCRAREGLAGNRVVIEYYNHHIEKHELNCDVAALAAGRCTYGAYWRPKGRRLAVLFGGPQIRWFDLVHFLVQN